MRWVDVKYLVSNNKINMSESIGNLCHAFPLYYDKEKRYIYTENFHDYEEDERDYYYIWYETFEEPLEFCIKFEGTKRYCVESLTEYLKNNPPTYVRDS